MKELIEASSVTRFLDQGLIREELHRHRDKLWDAETIFVVNPFLFVSENRSVNAAFRRAPNYTYKS
jgi:hypothetical protein